jgi:hypothetical protein
LRPRAATQLECLCVGLLVVALVAVNRPRVAELVRASAPPLLPSEKPVFPIERLQTERANVLLIDMTEWQRRHLRRLDQCQEIASRQGWGRDAFRAAFGRQFLPGAVGPVQRPELFDQYDAAALLDLPDRGNPVEPEAVRAALGELYAEEPPPRPGWISPKDKWPPQ